MAGPRGALVFFIVKTTVFQERKPVEADEDAGAALLVTWRWERRAQLTRASEKHTTAPSFQQCTRAPNQLRVVFRLTQLAVELSLSGVHQLDTAAACSPFSRLVSHGCAQGCGWASLDRRSQPEDAPCRSRRPTRRRHSKASTNKTNQNL